MPQPTVTAVHTSAILTNISVAYVQNAAHFVAGKVFPVVPVNKQTDSYYTYTKADWFRDEAKQRADSTESAGSGYGLSTASYSCDVYALHKDIGDQVRANEDAPLNSDRDATEFLTQRLLLRQEIQWAADCFATGLWGTSSTPSNLWSDYTTSDPLSDIETGKRTILINTGYMPNTFVVGYDVWIKLLHHPDIVDRIKYSSGNNSPAIVNEAAVASLCGVDRLLVAKAIKNTAIEGETASYSFTHGKHGLLAYVSPTPSILQPSAGYTFMWRGVSQGLGTTVGVKKFRIEAIGADRVEAQMAWDNKLVATDLGYFFDGAVA